MPADARNKTAALTIGEKENLAKTTQRVRGLPRGRWRRPATYHPGITTTLIGKLQSDLSYDGYATFKQWAAPEPTDTGSAEVELEYAAEKCFPWTIPDEMKIVSGSKVVVAWIAGRWYVVDGPCPVDV